MRAFVLTIVLCMIIVLVSAAYRPNLPFTELTTAYETDLEDKKQQALMFVEKVVGINLSNYVLNISILRPGEMIAVVIHISSEQGNATANVDFRREKISTFYLEPRSPPTWLWANETSNNIQAVTEILEQFDLNFNMSCTPLVQLLDQASPNQNQQINSGNCTLNIEEDGHRFTWSYVIDGIKVMTSIGMIISEEGHLTRFISNLGQYDIGSTLVAVSEEHAKNRALFYAEKYADEHGRTIKSITPTLIYETDIWGLRGGNEYTLYPQWSIVVAFDLPEGWSGGYSGYQVALWADTNGLIFAEPMGWFGEEPAQTNLLPLLLLIATTVTAIVIPALFIYRKHSNRPKVK